MPSSRIDGFAPIGAYALLGDMRSAALVADDGAIDWLALASIDSAPACAALLAPEQGGRITLAPTIPSEVERRYVPGTMVLQTTFTTAEGTVRVTDGLNFGALGTLPWTELARAVEVLDGEVPLAWTVAPGEGLSAQRRPWAYDHQGTPMILAGDNRLTTVVDGLGEPHIEEDRISGELRASEGHRGLLGIVGTRDESLRIPTADEIRERLRRTEETWQHWSSLVDDQGKWHDLMLRSALILKALTLKSSGGIAGAPTTSLPEQLGGERNFDYRFAWIRDASFALDAMSQLGLSEELHAGVTWMLKAVSQEAPNLRVFYALDGSPVPADMTKLKRIPGYRHSQPVNIGNGAASQTQLGAYGDLLDAVARYTRHGGVPSAADATMLAAIADHVCDTWASPDAGLWELSPPEQYTSSKLGCWMALDRAIELAESDQIPGGRVARWRAERGNVRAWIDERCWSERKRAYTFYAGTDELDAAVLLMARMGYCEPEDPRLSTTIDAIREELAAGPLLYRYSGQQDKEGAFLACSCWMVEALVHAGRAEEAEQLFGAFVDHVNDVGLLSEQIDPATGELLGNMPQALSHLAVIGAAGALNRAQEQAG